ncbi:hypothetical protein M1D80_06135 (plasmid) [Phyllobacteriaceae bacterium JZ32]
MQRRDPAAFTGTDPKLTMTGIYVHTPRISAGVTIDGCGVPGLIIDSSNEREIFSLRPDNPKSGSRIDATIRNPSLVNGRAKIVCRLTHISPLGWAHILLTGEYLWPIESVSFRP